MIILYAQGPHPVTLCFSNREGGGRQVYGINFVGPKSGYYFNSEAFILQFHIISSHLTPIDTTFIFYLQLQQN